MQLIKLDATDSTNTYLQALARRENLSDFTVVQARQQTAGKGQRGASWQTESGKNLTFSVLKQLNSFRAQNHFLLNAAISLSIYSALKTFDIPDLSVKWPNDILSGRQKLCGILIENQLQGSSISRSIIGIGLNVNQVVFENLPGATSMKLLKNLDFDIDRVLGVILNHLQEGLAEIGGLKSTNVLGHYESHLYLKGIKAVFQQKEGAAFEGIIHGVQPDGRLRMIMPEGDVQSFGFKEIIFP